MEIELRILSSLEKVFVDECAPGGYARATALIGETFSFQAAWKRIEGNERDYTSLSVTGDANITVRHVRQIPVAFPTFADADDFYLRKTPGLYPDLLEDVRSPRAYTARWESAWIDIECDRAGTFEVKVNVGDAEQTFTLDVIAAELPKQELIHTKWFHCDCLCNYYHVDMWSERFWEICEAFMRSAVKRGINMILTPVHTPPLDTKEGGERLTCQLVDIAKNGDKWEFGFDRFEKWVALTKKVGYEYYEIAHLFTQWGARHAPKIMATVDGEYKKIFGWETDAAGKEYGDFLAAYLPALIAEFKKLGIAEKCWFHISDEPNVNNLEDYMKARAQAVKFLDGFNIMDALSDFAFYKSGAVKKPVPAVNHIQPFIDANIEGLWAYYCVGQYKDNVPNMFVSMPAARNRGYGVLLYKYNIEGILQWGYNFYNSQYSIDPINPFINTDGDGFVPAGDMYQVYPGADGKPMESMRMMVTYEALADLRAMKLLEGLKGRDFVMSIIEDGIPPLKFNDFPKDAEYYLRTRDRINRAIAEAI